MGWWVDGGACGNKGRRKVRVRGDWVNEKRELVRGDEGMRKGGRVKVEPEGASRQAEKLKKRKIKE